MNAKQKAAQIYDQYWSAVSRRPASNKDPLPDIRPLIERALIETEEIGARREREEIAQQIEEWGLTGIWEWEEVRGVEQIDTRKSMKAFAEAIRARSEGDNQKGD